jgi:hypothetical protein
LSVAALKGSDVLACEALDVASGTALLRLDEVCFPPNAIAYRHVHAGAGFRHLLRGALRIEADNHTDQMEVGSTWFEAANSPVRATATAQNGVSSFVRCMLLPASALGKSTLDILSKEDAALPRLQSTHRHTDQLIELP